ncbi:MAG: hypothetical protein OXN17_13135 [Candidatus Poribacteria bacterium]|nr:hypothetical protein [Candidatus Poribacteria bacterium]MDE0502642.1 hypothetical protein [Candidatus Poribacteria bacterium]
MIGGGLVAWIVVGGIVSLFFSTKVVLKNDFIAEHSHNSRLCWTCARDIIEELPYTPEKENRPNDKLSQERDFDKEIQWLFNPRVRVKHQPDWAAEAHAFVIYVGLLCGVAWAIENDRARWRFFWWTCGGVSVGWISHLVTGNASVCWALIVLGLFVGVVSALASVGAYRKN